MKRKKNRRGGGHGTTIGQLAVELAIGMGRAVLPLISAETEAKCATDGSGQRAATGCATPEVGERGSGSDLRAVLSMIRRASSSRRTEETIR